MALESNWLAEQVAGLDVGAGRAVAVQLRRQRDRSIGLLAAGMVDLDPEAPEREQARVLRALWRRAGLRTCTVCASLRSPTLLLKFFRYDGLSEAELASTLRLEAEASQHSDPQNLLIDWQITSRSEINGRLRLEGVLVAAPKAPVDRLQRLLQRAGLYPVIVDASCLALANLARALKGGLCAKETVALVHLSDHSADLAILGQEGDVYPRLVLTRSPTWEETARYVMGSVEDHLKYYTFKLRGRTVDRVLLTGMAPGNGDFAKFLSASTSVAVEPWNPLQDLRPVHRGAARQVEHIGEEAGLFAPALGLALRGLPP